ncbi:MAG TPA: phosphotransferase [Pirellulales bacterium]|nr:phosphotransferase [Pirellulales bacterium]
MLDNPYNLSPILAYYPTDCQPTGAPESIADGGFSGSRIWRVQTQRGVLCLRCWPSEYPAQRLAWIHGILARVYSGGFCLVPVPIRAISCDTFVCRNGYLWQLEPWLLGKAQVDNAGLQPISPARVESAVTALAEFHIAVAADPANHLPDGPPPGIVQRLAQLNALQSGGLDRLSEAIASKRHVWLELAERAVPLLAAFRLVAPARGERLRQAAQQCVAIRPCIRDIHREHVLFEGDRVTGIVDFGAMQPDNVACDIARLLGSMAGDDAALWQAGLQAYQRLQALSEVERPLVQIYDESSTLLSGIHWLQWVFAEGRQFENRQGVLMRFEEILGRLIRLAQRKSHGEGVIV